MRALAYERWAVEWVGGPSLINVQSHPGAARPFCFLLLLLLLLLLHLLLLLVVVIVVVVFRHTSWA